MRRCYVLGVFLGVCCMLVGPWAYADTMAVVVRPADPSAQKAAQQVSYYMHEMVSKEPGHTLVSLEEALGNPDLERIQQTLRGASEARDKARVSYDSLDLDAVVQELNDALSKWERYPAYIGAPKEVVEALLLLGAAHVLRGEDSMGVKKFESAIVLSPHTDPDPRIFNPSMRELYSQAQSRVGNRRRGVLSVTSVPVAAEVYVDGQFVGVTPVALQGVVEGRHMVVVKKDGYRGWGRMVDVQGAVETVETANLRPVSDAQVLEQASSALEGSLTDKSAKSALSSLGVSLKVGEVIYLRVSSEGDWTHIEGVFFSVPSQRVVREVSHSVLNRLKPEAYKREMADLAKKCFGASLAAGSLKKKGSEESENDIPPPLSGAGRYTASWRKNVFLYGLVGGGAAVALTGGVLWIFAKQSQSTFKESFQTSQEAADAKTKGKALAVGGDIAMGIGGAAVLTGLAMYFFWKPAEPQKTGLYEEKSSQPWAFSGFPIPGGGALYASVNY